MAGTPNRATAEIKAIAGAYSAETIEILINIARNADGDSAKVAACRELLDRGHGKASQRLDVDSNINIASDENALLEGRRRVACRALPSAGYATQPEYENNIE